MPAKGRAKTERVHCKDCRRPTDHRFLKTSNNSGETDNGDWYSVTSDMLQCCCCQLIVLCRTASYNDETPDIRYYPPRVSRRPPSWRYNIPPKIRALVDEVYAALDANGRSLPMMGARAIVDMLMVEKTGDAGTFKSKLKKLQSDGFVSVRNCEFLEAALDAGSAAAHRGHSPEPFEIDAVMDIVENLLQPVYVLPRRADTLKRTTPPRLRSKLKTLVKNI